MIGPRKMLILSGSTPLYVLLLRGSGTPRYRPQRPPVGRLVLDDDLNVAHRRMEVGRQGAQRVVNRLCERIVETRLPTRIHLRNDARIGRGAIPPRECSTDTPLPEARRLQEARRPGGIRPPELGYFFELAGI